jgi:asparagine synthase (glutamine-hydrolysing)
MRNPASQSTIVFNGKIYYYIELRKDIQVLGHAFLTASDTEVILVACREWGVDCLAHLRGMFSLAIHDAARHRVVLAGDRAGEKPRFYSHSGGVLTFGSREPLAARSLVARDYSCDAITDPLIETCSEGMARNG